MEPISTLIFAAARFPDLPELRDLRCLFAERYGSHMESSVKAEVLDHMCPTSTTFSSFPVLFVSLMSMISCYQFVEKIQKRSFSQEKKLQLIKDIAQGFSVTWDSSPFEHKLSNLSARKSVSSKYM